MKEISGKREAAVNAVTLGGEWTVVIVEVGRLRMTEASAFRVHQNK